MRAWVAAAFGVLCAAIGVNLLATALAPGVALDLTANHAFTLTPATRATLAALRDPVTLRLFYSRRLGAALPAYGAMADRVEQTLRQYATLSHGKVRVITEDPEPYSEAEDRAIAFGLSEVPLDQGGDKVFFGLTGTNLLDDEQTIAFFKPEREPFLEYDLTRLVYDLSNPDKPKLGLMSQLPLEGDPRAMLSGGGTAAPYAIMQPIRATNEVVDVPPDVAAIDPAIGTLMVVANAPLPEPALRAIDQFVMRGGKLLAFIDPWSDEASTRGGPATPVNPLARLTEAWGVAMDPTQIVGDLGGAWKVRSVGNDRLAATEYVAWFSVKDGIDHDDPAIGDLRDITVATPGALTRLPNAPGQFTPLLSSGLKSELLPVASVRQPDPARLLAEFQATGPRVLAARLTGPLPSAFEAGAHATDAAVILVADTDLLADRFWVRETTDAAGATLTPFADNGAFVAGLIDALSGNAALQSLRPRASVARPFTVVAALRAEAEAQFRRSEQELRASLAATEAKLRELRTGDTNAATLTPEQSAAIDAAETDIFANRARLRAVQLDLNRGIDGLRARVTFANIVAVPAAVTLAAIGLAALRARRRRIARDRAARQAVGLPA